MKSTPKIALIGYGSIAPKHLEVFSALGAPIHAICSRNAGRRQEAREKWGIAAGYADYHDMMIREKPDCIVLTVPIDAVFDITKALIPFGVPLLIEKPPGLSVAQTTELASLALHHNVPVMVGLNRRFYSVYHRGLERLGGLDAITSVRVEWSEAPCDLLKCNIPIELVKLYIYANSIHGLDLITFFAGEVPSPWIWGRNLDPGFDRLRLQMEAHGISVSGKSASFTASWDSPGNWRLVVDSQDMRMISAPLETALILSRPRESMHLESSQEDLRFKPGFHGQAAYFLRVVADNIPIEWPACSLAASLSSMNLAESLTHICMPHLKQ